MFSVPHSRNQQNQGDLLIQTFDKFTFGKVTYGHAPTNEKAILPTHERGLILHTGEKEGHCHTLELPTTHSPEAVASTEIFLASAFANGTVLIRTGDAGARISHDTHGPITLPPNADVLVSRQREYDPVHGETLIHD